jgi:hypothetical protein
VVWRDAERGGQMRASRSHARASTRSAQGRAATEARARSRFRLDMPTPRNRRQACSSKRRGLGWRPCSIRCSDTDL